MIFDELGKIWHQRQVFPLKLFFQEKMKGKNENVQKLTWVEPKSLEDLRVGTVFWGVLTFPPDGTRTAGFWFSGLADIATLFKSFVSSDRTGALGVDGLKISFLWVSEKQI